MRIASHPLGVQYARPGLGALPGASCADCGWVIVRHSPNTPWRLRRASLGKSFRTLPQPAASPTARAPRGEEMRPLFDLSLLALARFKLL
jgi:hypothetical protein